MWAGCYSGLGSCSPNNDRRRNNEFLIDYNFIQKMFLCLVIMKPSNCSSTRQTHRSRHPFTRSSNQSHPYLQVHHTHSILSPIKPVSMPVNQFSHITIHSAALITCVLTFLPFSYARLCCPMVGSLLRVYSGRIFGAIKD